MRLTVLGSGTSSGVPRIGGDWGVCDPAEPKNRRRRVSVLVEQGAHALLIDTSPDMREQLLDAGVGHLDAVFYTHDHADHAHGIDDLRPLCHAMGRKIDCYATSATWDVLGSRFSYIFEGAGDYPAIAEKNILPDQLMIGSMRVTPFRQRHGPIDSVGYRIDCGGKSLAYSTDINGIPPESERHLQGLDLWVVDALRRHPHPTHAHLALTLEWIARYQPRHAVLTHMDNSMDYRTLCNELPQGVMPGHDGLVIDLA